VEEKRQGEYRLQKFWNFIGWLVIGFSVALFLVAANWYWIKNDAAIQWLVGGFLFSFAGAVAGGLAGGYGSYLGGIQGAEKEALRQQDVAKRKLGRTLKFTLLLVKQMAVKVEGGGYRNINDVFFDPRMLDYAAEIDDLSTEEISALFSWKYYLSILGNRINATQICKREDVPQQLFDQKLQETIRSLANRFWTKEP
jgi:hypothetical protein